MQHQRLTKIAPAFLIVAALLTGCGKNEQAESAKPAPEPAGGKKLSLAFVGYSTTNPFWISVRDAAKAEAERQGHAFKDLTSAQPDAMMQKQAVDNAVARKVDGIIIGAVDNRAFNDSLNKAKAAGIPCVAVDTGIDHEWISSLVQTDNIKAAKLAGKYIVDTGKSAKVLINGGAVGHQTGDARRDGVKTVVEAAGGEVIFRACDWLPDKAYETTLNELTANPDITAIFNACDPMAMSAISAARQKGKDVLIVGFDGDPANLKAIAAGKQHADIKQDSRRMGTESVANLIKVINGETVPQVVPIDGILITKDNVAEYLK